MVLKKRLFIGNLHPDIQDEDLRSRFSSFGTVDHVEIRQKNEAIFSFIDIQFGDEGDMRRCVDVLNNTKWKGLIIKVQIAKESFIDKLKKERQYAKEKARRDERPKPPDNFDFEIVDANETTTLSPSVKINVTPKPETVQDKTHPPKISSKASKPVVAVFNNFLNIPITKPKPQPVNLTSATSTTSPVKNPKESSDSDSSDSDSESDTERNGLPKFRGLSSYPGLLGSKMSDVIEQFVPVPNPKVPVPSQIPVVPKEPFKLKLNPNKKSKSEKLRAQSLMSKEKVLETRSSVIRNALAKIDVKPVSATSTPSNTGQTQDDTKYLFGDEVPDEEADDTLNFQIKPQYEGETGQKNLNVKSNFGFDERFKLDGRFAEKQKTTSPGEGEQASQSEKNAQLEILTEIIGPLKPSPKAQQVKANVKTQSQDLKAILPFIRFDPKLPAHQIFRKDFQEEQLKAAEEPVAAALVNGNDLPTKPKSKAKKDKQKSKEIEDEKAQLLNTSAKPTYKVAENLKNLFATSATEKSTGFSLLQTFGKVDSSHENANGTNSYATEPIHSKSKSKKSNGIYTDKNPFKYDSSDDEDGEPSKKKSKTNAAPPVPAPGPEPRKNYFKQDLFKKDSLFFKPNDIRLSGVFDKFLQTSENLDEVTKKFNETERAELKLIAKSKWKNSHRKNEKRIKVMKLVRKKKKRDAVQRQKNKQQHK